MKNQPNGSGRPLVTFAMAIVIALVMAAAGSASGPLGIYGIVEKVVFEPNERAPQRLQVWGAFAYSEGRTPMPSSARRGYLYFRLPESGEPIDLVRREWADLKAIAGSGQAVSFGSWGWSSVVRAERSELRVHPASETPSAPAEYRTDSGIVKLSADGNHAALVKQLRELITR